jgi:transcriptional regulator with XRE-family HTH domain
MPKSVDHRKILGDNIRACRKRAKLTLERLAEKTDMDWTYLSQVERGRENISVDKLALIASALNVTLSDLVQGA